MGDQRFGLTITRKPKTGVSVLDDIAYFLGRTSVSPIIFDVGANIGQSVKLFKGKFPFSTIYSFEPSPSTFARLKCNCEKYLDVHLLNCALGRENDRLELIENERSELSSFLRIGPAGSGRLKGETSVDVFTADEVVKKEGLPGIDPLKCDTEGFDYEVMLGVQQSFEKGVIKLILVEIAFVERYQNERPFYDVIKYICEQGFHFVASYHVMLRDDLAACTDVLFISKQYYSAKTI